ncbi:MAG: DUF58 domain-containing protein [Sedimentisphaerales bacterium]|nr:DUF58 domain-containing protein [Sedimentisphaerales bacterium]
MAPPLPKYPEQSSYHSAQTATPLMASDVEQYLHATAQKRRRRSGLLGWIGWGFKTILFRSLRFRGYVIKFFLTESGKLVIAAVILTAIFNLFISDHYLCSIALAALVVAPLVGLAFYPRVQLKGVLPERMIAGQQVNVPFMLTNPTRRTFYDLAVGFSELPPGLAHINADTFVPRLAPGESTTLEVTLLPARRGAYTFPSPRCYSTFPLNLFRYGHYRRQDVSLLVHPEFDSLEAVEVAPDLRYQPGGVAYAGSVGESPEYLGNREFRPGDSPRKIDNRAWARLSRPVVKEFREEYYCHVALVLDTRVMMHWRKKPSKAFEAAVSLTAALAESLSRSERIIDFFVAGPDLYVFRSGRHTAGFENLLDILACVQPCRSNPFEVIAPALADQLAQTSSVIFILLDFDEAREQLLRLAVEAGCETKVVLVRDTATTRSYHSAEAWSGPVQVIEPSLLRSGGLRRL